LKLYEQVGDNLGKANTLKAIGDVALANEQYPEALQHYRQALALVEQIHDLYSTARVWYYIGIAYATQGDKPEAISAFTTAASIFRDIKLEDLAQFCEGAIEEIE
jgi:tetratricopeptide (TPR) repeat protein